MSADDETPVLIAAPQGARRPFGKVSWERMTRAVEKIRQRLRRAAAALEAAGIPYPLARGNAVAAWVFPVGEAAGRNTQNLDILLRRPDLPGAMAAMAQAGFFHPPTPGPDLFP